MWRALTRPSRSTFETMRAHADLGQAIVATLAIGIVTGFIGGIVNMISRRPQDEFGGELDSLADYVLVVMLAAGLCWLWPDMVRTEWPWIAAGFAVP